MAKKNRIDQICQAEPANIHKSWFDKMSESDRSELIEIRNRFRNGQTEIKTVLGLARLIVEAFKINKNAETVAKWLKD